MKVYVTKTLVEDVDCNSCSVEVFETLADARKWANEEIHSYADDYPNAEVETADDWYRMTSGDTYVTIEIAETEIHKGEQI